MKKIKIFLSILTLLGLICTFVDCGEGYPEPNYPPVPEFPGEITPPDSGNTGTDTDIDTDTEIYTISYVYPDPDVCSYFPESKQVKSGYELTAEDLPTTFPGANFTIERWYNDVMETVSVGYLVTYDLNLSPVVNDIKEELEGKSGYLTVKFDVSDVNKIYSLSLETPSDLELTAAECDAEEKDGAYAYVEVFDKVPQIEDQYCNGAKYKLFWEFTHYNESLLIADDLNLKTTTHISGEIGKVVTLKAVLKKYGTVSFTTAHGTITETLELYETQEVYMSSFPVPKGALRVVYDYKNGEEYVFKHGDPLAKYEGTGEDVTFEVVFAKPKVGDIILTDGSAKHPSQFNAETDKALAVYFYVGEGDNYIDDYLAVGIEKASKIKWSTLENSQMAFWNKYIRNENLTDEQKKKFESMYYTKDYIDYDGSDNYSIIKELDPEGEYPAFEYAETYGVEHGAEIDILKTGWYLPTVIECSNLVAALKPMDDVLKMVGANFAQKSTAFSVNNYFPWTSNVNEFEPFYCWIQPELDQDGLNCCNPNYYTENLNLNTVPSEEWDAFAVIKILKD